MSEHEEGWVAARGWEGLYEVSNLGGVRSIPRLGITTFGKRMYGGSLVTPLCTRELGTSV
ncbi:NUMOD4 domain-containing protein [Aeromonas caviae]